MISIEHLSKTYVANQVLHELSMRFGQGRTTALLGPNGSGKTTIIKSILGLVHADSGALSVNNVDVRQSHDYRALIGYMPQIARYPDNLTVSEVLSMIADLRDEEPQRMNDLIELFELQPHLQKTMKSLSGGTRQKVSAVAAMMFDVPILILDEPSAGLDPLMARRLKDLIRHEKLQGKTIILTTHILAEIEELADDIAFILEGRLIFHGSLQELLELTGHEEFEQAVATLQSMSTQRRAA